jgi:hypothetical protein
MIAALASADKGKRFACDFHLVGGGAARSSQITYGAGYETRTRDLHLGKVALYQLS